MKCSDSTCSADHLQHTDTKKTANCRANLRLALIFVLVIVIDQITKYYMLQEFVLGESLPIIDGFFNLTLVHNKGAAFGMMAGLGDPWRHVVLGLTTALALVMLIYFMLYEYRNKLAGQTALVLILAGALGNVIDRTKLGFVVDFLDFYLGSWHWPAFNVADSSIFIGVSFLLINGLLEKRAALAS